MEHQDFTGNGKLKQLFLQFKSAILDLLSAPRKSVAQAALFLSLWERTPPSQSPRALWKGEAEGGTYKVLGDKLSYWKVNLAR